MGEYSHSSMGAPIENPEMDEIKEELGFKNLSKYTDEEFDKLEKDTEQESHIVLEVNQGRSTDGQRKELRARLAEIEKERERRDEVIHDSSEHIN